MDDLISRQFLIEAFKEEFYAMYSDDFNYMIKWFENLPAADSSEFCDQLWTIAYEHGKRDAQPATEPKTGLYVVGFNDGYEAGKEDAQQDIVHCKDCRWWRAPDDGCNHWDGMVTAPANGFCSYGERMEES